MAKRKGFVGLMNQVAREQAHAQRRAVADYNRQVRELTRYEKQLVREQKQFEKELCNLIII